MLNLKEKKTGEKPQQKPNKEKQRNGDGDVMWPI